MSKIMKVALLAGALAWAASHMLENPRISVAILERIESVFDAASNIG